MPTLKGAEESLSYVQCFLYLVSSSINVTILTYCMAGYFLNRPRILHANRVVMILEGNYNAITCTDIIYLHLK